MLKYIKWKKVLFPNCMILLYYVLLAFAVTLWCFMFFSTHRDSFTTTFASVGIVLAAYGCFTEASSEVARQFAYSPRYTRLPSMPALNCVVCNIVTLQKLGFGAGDHVEAIMASAILMPYGTVYAVFMPGRHHHCLELMDLDGRAGDENLGEEIEGFLTNMGRFVDRQEAFVIATKANQIKVKTGGDTELYSECIW